MRVWVLLVPALMPIIIHVISSNLLRPNINLYRHGYVATDCLRYEFYLLAKSIYDGCGLSLWTLLRCALTTCGCERLLRICNAQRNNIISTSACGQWLRRPLTEWPSHDTVKPLSAAGTGRDVWYTMQLGTNNVSHSTRSIVSPPSIASHVYSVIHT